MVDYTTSRSTRSAPGGGLALFTVSAIAATVLVLAALDSRSDWPGARTETVAAE